MTLKQASIEIEVTLVIVKATYFNSNITTQAIKLYFMSHVKVIVLTHYS